MKKALLPTGLALLALVAGAALLWHKRDSPPRHETWPLTFSQEAYDLSFDPEGAPQLDHIETRLPVMTYAGYSADQRFMAYTAADTPSWYLDHDPVRGPRLFVSPPAGTLRLVPSGDLYIEATDHGVFRKVNAENQFVIAAAWSPTKSNLLAYTFTSGDATRLAIVDIQTGADKVSNTKKVLADYLAWISNGAGVQAFLREPGQAALHLAQFSADSLTRDYGAPTDRAPGLPQLDAAPATTPRQSFSIPLASKKRIHGDDILGISFLSVLSSSGKVLRTLRADSILAATPAGVAYKSLAAGKIAIGFLAADGEIVPLFSMPNPLELRLPWPPPFNIAVTQVGAGYKTACQLTHHTSALAYAYDFQEIPASEDMNLVAAADGTIASIYNDVDCATPEDGPACSECPLYAKGYPGGRSGWGNTVIFYHLDGSYTQYSHVRYGRMRWTGLPLKTGDSIRMGRPLGGQGYGGTAAGGGKECDDHLHFQRQKTSDRAGTSLGVGFSGVEYPLRCATYKTNNVAR